MKRTHDWIRDWVPWCVIVGAVAWSTIDVRMRPPILYDAHTQQLLEATGVLATQEDLASLKQHVAAMADDRIRYQQVDRAWGVLREHMDLPPLEYAVRSSVPVSSLEQKSELVESLLEQAVRLGVEHYLRRDLNDEQINEIALELAGDMLKRLEKQTN